MVSNQANPAHVEIPVKVTAWIDAAVAPLVVALNRFEQVLTLDSCEGYGDEPSYVYFRCRGGPMKLCTFVHDLSVALGQRIKADNEFHLRIKWVAGSKEPMATLYSRRDWVQRLSRVIEEIAVNGDHTKASTHDT